MTETGKAIKCPFDFSEGMEFDPSLAALMERDSIARIRLPYGSRIRAMESRSMSAARDGSNSMPSLKSNGHLIALPVSVIAYYSRSRTTSAADAHMDGRKTAAFAVSPHMP